jgi:CheY-like chemotaxis protein
LPTKILIVEDDADARDYLAILLQLEGYTVLTAEDGVAGIEQTIANHPDIILSDIHMPNLDGVEMVKKLRRIPEGRQIPIVMISAYGMEKLQEALDAGATLALYKPLHVKSLMTSVSSLVH